MAEVHGNRTHTYGSQSYWDFFIGFSYITQALTEKLYAL